MIVIDTNVVSEMMRSEPDRAVLAWADGVGRVHTTAITLAEVGYGIARLPSGRRRDRLAEAAAGVFADFGDVILAFDAGAADHYPRIVVDRERSGRPSPRGTPRSLRSAHPGKRHWPPAPRTTSRRQASRWSTRGADEPRSSEAGRQGRRSAATRATRSGASWGSQVMRGSRRNQAS